MCLVVLFRRSGFTISLVVAWTATRGANPCGCAACVISHKCNRLAQASNTITGNKFDMRSTFKFRVHFAHKVLGAPGHMIVILQTRSWRGPLVAIVCWVLDPKFTKGLGCCRKLRWILATTKLEKCCEMRTKAVVCSAPSLMSSDVWSRVVSIPRVFELDGLTMCVARLRATGGRHRGKGRASLGDHHGEDAGDREPLL